ncbi:copper-binding protein [Rhodobacter lacus]|uniref:Copper-binding protein n=1 Tax=Rhodobacter lacus TaxID=1641972 RepID=A0ABW5AA22_9RHOB
MRKILIATLLSFGFAPVALAQMDHSAMDHSAMPMATQMVHVEATLNAIGEGTINVSHGPIKEIGWPAMTMDMPLMQGVSLPENVKPGDQILLMLSPDADGMYGVSGVAALN